MPWLRKPRCAGIALRPPHRALPSRRSRAETKYDLRSSEDRSDPETVSGSRGFTPPTWQNLRKPTGGDTPAPAAAFSVIAPQQPPPRPGPGPAARPPSAVPARESDPDSHEPPTAASPTPSHTSEISRCCVDQLNPPSTPA